MYLMDYYKMPQDCCKTWEQEFSFAVLNKETFWNVVKHG